MTRFERVHLAMPGACVYIDFTEDGSPIRFEYMREYDQQGVAVRRKSTLWPIFMQLWELLGCPREPVEE